MTGRWVWLGAAAAFISLAWIVAERLDSQSLAFVSGVVCGIGGSIPAAALFFRFQQRENHSPFGGADAREPLPQVFMAPPAPQAYTSAVQGSFTEPPFQRIQRGFTIVGEEEREDGITQTRRSNPGT